MYIKVYIFGMEMSKRIHFWYQILPKMMIFLWENGKNHFGLKILGQPTKKQFWVKNAEIAWKSGKKKKDVCPFPTDPKYQKIWVVFFF